jgi:hypothetical protein
MFYQGVVSLFKMAHNESLNTISNLQKIAMIEQRKLNNIHKLPLNDVFEIAKECDEALGRVSIDEYSKATGIPIRTVYDHIKKGKIRTLSGMPCINLK